MSLPPSGQRQLREDFGEEQLRRWAWRSNIQVTPRPISLYVHVPCSYSSCFDCGGNGSLGREPARSEHYVARLLQELRLIAPLFDTRREVFQLHLGGGTAHFLSPTQLSRLLVGLAGGFRLSRAGCDLPGLGAGAISHIGSSLSQNHAEISGWEAALAQNQLPVARGLELG